jgi:hypothetical protein
MWRGWTTKESAPAYERVVRGQVIPGIESRHIPGFIFDKRSAHFDVLDRREQARGAGARR